MKTIIINVLWFLLIVTIVFLFASLITLRFELTIWLLYAAIFISILLIIILWND